MRHGSCPSPVTETSPGQQPVAEQKSEGRGSLRRGCGSHGGVPQNHVITLGEPGVSHMQWECWALTASRHSAAVGQRVQTLCSVVAAALTGGAQGGHLTVQVPSCGHRRGPAATAMAPTDSHRNRLTVPTCRHKTERLVSPGLMGCLWGPDLRVTFPSARRPFTLL